jgi:flavin reductase (DIM6/NTAB) family NADH-FMN oxidoreductase RutF
MRKQVNNFLYIVETNKLLRKNGILLVAEGLDKKPNAMTIGWGFLGTMWRNPVFVVAVRHSRHTFTLMEESENFIVCLPAKGMEEVLEICGTKSGRDIDKFKECNFTPVKGKMAEIPYIKECPVHFECKIIYKDDLLIGALPEEIKEEVYPNKNMHMLYYGEVKGVYADDNANITLME